MEITKCSDNSQTNFQYFNHAILSLFVLFTFCSIFKLSGYHL
jgi:hypothetical protein